MSFLFLWGGICDRSLKGRLAHPALNQPKLSSCEPPDLSLKMNRVLLFGHSWFIKTRAGSLWANTSAALCGGRFYINCEWKEFGTHSPRVPRTKVHSTIFWYCISTFPFLVVDNFATSQLAWLGKSSVKTVPHTQTDRLNLAGFCLCNSPKVLKTLMFGTEKWCLHFGYTPRRFTALNLKSWWFKEDVFRLFPGGGGPVFSGT